MSLVLSKPSDHKRSGSSSRAGGDDGVERDGMGRPRVWVPCERCNQTGEVPSEKRPGKFNQCPTCKGGRSVKRSYTRMTTFIDVLEDKAKLADWKMRNVLLGVAADPGFLVGVSDMDPEGDQKELSRRAEAAAEVAGASVKSRQGSHLHTLSELIDAGESLPAFNERDGMPVTEADRVDMFAYWEATAPLFEIVRVEQLVVNDRFKVAGTPDRNSRPRKVLVAPNGEKLTPDDVLITDLKTGRVDYGQLKMCMQLAGYANSPLYDKGSGGRVYPPNVSRSWGIIMHLPAGSGVCRLYWADLRLGWEALQLASSVRAMRKMNRHALTPVADEVYEASVF